MTGNASKRGRNSLLAQVEEEQWRQVSPSRGVPIARVSGGVFVCVTKALVRCLAICTSTTYF